jgi:hypothetical protein
MGRAERLTLDSTVVIDLLQDDQPRHALAVLLVELARLGEVELAVATSGQIFDNIENAAARSQQLEGEGIMSTVQLAYPGVMFPGANLFPGAGVPGFRAAWNTILGTWKTHEGRPPGDHDALHVETHILEERDVFISDDRALRAMCRRLADEHSFDVVAMSLSEYLEQRSTLAATSPR